MKVYKAINDVQRELSAVGIGKNNRNSQQGYNFRGIDDVLNAIGPIASKAGLCILPRLISRHCDERVNAKGTALFYTVVEMEYDLVCAEDGSKHTVRTAGEAMDSGDKSTNKAMSAAMKYMAIQTFTIPTVGDEGDADSHSPEPMPRQSAPSPAPAPALSADTQGIVSLMLEAWTAGDKGTVMRVCKDIPEQEKKPAVAAIKAAEGGSQMLAYIASANK